MIRVTAIRVHYKASIPRGTREKAERALKVYAEKCPAYVTVRDCLAVTSTAELREEGEDG